MAADYRLVGGHMVELLVTIHHVTDVPARETADADLGAEVAVVGDQRLLDALTNLGYVRPGHRFARMDRQSRTRPDHRRPRTLAHRPPPANKKHGALMACALAGVRPADAADASGLVTTIVQLAQVVGLAALGAVYLSLVPSHGSPHAIEVALLIEAVATALAAGAALRVPRTNQ